MPTSMFYLSDTATSEVPVRNEKTYARRRDANAKVPDDFATESVTT